MADALTREILPNLDVMTSGPIPPNPSELLGSANMQTFLNKVSDYYDYIILDTPPINIVTDMAVMANFISGVLLVSYYASTTIEDVRRAQEALKIVNAKILGLVVAGVIRKKGNKGDYYEKADNRRQGGFMEYVDFHSHILPHMERRIEKSRKCLPKC